MDPQQQLNDIYESIGGGAECTEALMARIDELTAIINPQVAEPEADVFIEGVCGDPYCNGYHCWECAAIRGGNPEDV